MPLWKAQTISLQAVSFFSGGPGALLMIYAVVTNYYFKLLSFYLFFFSFIFVFSGLHSRHMKVPRLGVESEQQLPAYATATATHDPSRVCNVHHSSQQCRILNPLSEARD